MSMFLLMLFLPLIYPSQSRSQAQDLRERLAGEIIPVKATQSNTEHDEDGFYDYSAANAIDLDLATMSRSATARDGSNDSAWLKVSLDQGYCIEQVKYLTFVGVRGRLTPEHTWNCGPSDCTCEGDKCPDYSLEVRVEQARAGILLPAASNCKYGDTVVLKPSPTSTAESLDVYELPIIGKKVPDAQLTRVVEALEETNRILLEMSGKMSGNSE